MPDAPKTKPPEQDEVEKFLAERKTFEDRRQEMIKEVLHQKEAAIKVFDEKLAKLGHHPPTTRSSKRSHHKHDTEKKSGE